MKITRKRNLLILTSILLTIILSTSYAIFVVSTKEYRASEMLIAKLIYGINLKLNTEAKEGTTVTLKPGTTIIDVEITSFNEIESKYQLEYKLETSNENIKIYYLVGKEDDPNGSISSYNEANGTYKRKVKVVVETEKEMNISFNVSGGYNKEGNMPEIEEGYTPVTSKGHEITMTGSNMTTNPTSPIPIKEGDSKQIGITPISGYKVTNISCTNGNSKLESNTLTISNVTSDTTCIVTTEKITHIVTANITGGKLSPESPQIVEDGGNITFTITPDGSNYTVTSQTGDCIVDNMSIIADHVTKDMECSVDLGPAQCFANVFVSHDGGYSNDWNKKYWGDCGSSYSLHAFEANCGLGFSIYGSPQDRYSVQYNNGNIYLVCYNI